jgi:hypothetical protein
MSVSAREHYALLFSDLEQKCGPISDASHIGIVGFSAGGPVAMCQVGLDNHFVTCELSLYPGQKLSSQDLKYELLSRINLSVSDSQKLLTALGNFSMDETLGHSHTIDVASFMPPNTVSMVKLLLLSQREIGGARYGVYEVCVEN